ncbi:hypothetical protein ACQKP0_23775 [Heyndrickxia sp. NPDC080065]|uniref:hypothetical protein n=1 Tax=Heyndrickxia sp. NPDC080065 TaxID=3390568 RepID=UPI003CFD8633
MMQRRKKLKKGTLISGIIACGLVFGSIGVGVEASAATNNMQQASKSVSVKKAAATVSKKGIMSFPKKFNKKNVINELKPEAVKLIKMYADTLKTGKTKTFDTYVDKHIMDGKSTIFVGSRKNAKNSYKISIKNDKKYNSKKKIVDYSTALKKVTSSKLVMEQNYSKDYAAHFSYEYKPKGFFISAKVSFSFIQSNGKYVLTAINFY